MNCCSGRWGIQNAALLVSGEKIFSITSYGNTNDDLTGESAQRVAIWLVAMPGRGMLCCGGNNLAINLAFIVFD